MAFVSQDTTMRASCTKYPKVHLCLGSLRNNNSAEERKGKEMALPFADQNDSFAGQHCLSDTGREQ